eukprot:3863810-Rhodomonas_salina.1
MSLSLSLPSLPPFHAHPPSLAPSLAVWVCVQVPVAAGAAVRDGGRLRGGGAAGAQGDTHPPQPPRPL